jgi:hypothetical protein
MLKYPGLAIAPAVVLRSEAGDDAKFTRYKPNFVFMPPMEDLAFPAFVLTW